MLYQNGEFIPGNHAGRLTYSSGGGEIGRVNESRAFREIVAALPSPSTRC